MSQLSDNLKTLRMIFGLSIRQIAQQVDRSPSSISNWENDKQSPDVEALLKLCKIFSVSPNELTGWEPCKIIEEFKRKQAETLQSMNYLMQKRRELDNEIRRLEKLIIDQRTLSQIDEASKEQIQDEP